MRRISYSQVNTLNRCHFAWKINYVDKYTIKSGTKRYLEFGSQVDELLGIHYKNVHLCDDTLKLVEQKVAQFYQQAAGDPDALDIVVRAANVVKRYIEDFAPWEDKGLTFVEVQKYIEIPCRTKLGTEFILEGYIDLLVRDDASGQLYIWDHKTTGSGKSPGRFWTEMQALMDSQMPTYMAGLRAMGIPVAGVTINQLNGYMYKKEPTTEQMFRRLTTHRTQAELDNILRELSNAVDTMEALKESETYRRSLSKDCADCWFQEPCLVGMKGHDIQPILDANFKKKDPRP